MKRKGFARNNKFYVEFNPPNALAKTVFNRFGTRYNPDDIEEVNEEEQGFTSLNTMRDYHLSHGRSVQMFCNKITIPDRKMTMTEVKHNGLRESMFLIMNMQILLLRFMQISI